MAGNVRRLWAPLLLMVASGFAGLGYQIVWTQQCALWLGHESAAVLAVVAAFFGGVAVGALTLGARIERSLRPVRWYAGCELVIALWSLFLIVAMPGWSAWMLTVTGAQPAPLWHWVVAFSGTFFLLLPATAAMGATLPAMERMTARVHSEGRSIAGLYAGNTCGAVLGVLVAAFWLVPAVGLAWSTMVCVGLNLMCGVMALVAFPLTMAPRSPALVDAAGRKAARPLMWRLAFTGLLGIGYEVLVVRVLSQVTQNTVYTFAVLLAVYLLGTAAGAAQYARIASVKANEKLGNSLLGALAAACLISTATLWTAQRCKEFGLQLFGGSMTANVLAEAVPALLAFGPPTIVMGALFSHLGRQANEFGISFGRALGVNTLGAAAAPALFGVLVFPSVGPKFALLLISAGYLTLMGWRSWSGPIAWAPACAAFGLAFLAPPLAFVDVPQGGRVVSYQDGLMAAVSVVQDADGVSRLRINNRQQEGSSASLRVDGRQAWLPLLLHPGPQRALFLGLGTGITASTAAKDPTLRVDAVELLPEVVRASTHFTQAFTQSGAAQRLHVLVGDARRYVRTAGPRYDVIVSDNFHPARSGSGSLYTVEHFEAVRRRLAMDGLFCQWLPLHQLDLDTLRSIVKSFVTIYPQGWALLVSNSLETPVVGLVGRADGKRFDADDVRTRLVRLASPKEVIQLGFEDEFAVLGSFVAGPASLRRFSFAAAANTDDHPVVSYRAPRVTYVPNSSPRDRLTSLLQDVSVEPDELLDGSDHRLLGRLVAYWAARNRFVELGRNVRPSASVQDMLSQVRDPLLSVLRISPDFRPAYDPLLAMAAALAQHDPANARLLLSELTRIQPARPDAARALASLR